jgi:hypothetical protein
MKKISFFLSALFAMAFSATASAETDTVHSIVTATGVPIAISEFAPMTMTMSRAAGADMTGPIPLSTWETHFASDPATSLERGCILVTGEANSPITVSVVNTSDLDNGGFGAMTYSSSSLNVDGRTFSCGGSVTSGGDYSVGASPVGGTFALDSAGELYLTWAYDVSKLTVTTWEQGDYSGVIDLEIVYE